MNASASKKRIVILGGLDSETAALLREVALGA
jgi:hypothetical protein